MFERFEQFQDDPIRKFQAELEEAKQRSERMRPLLKSCEEAIQRSECKMVSIHMRPKAGFEPKLEIMITVSSLDETIPLFRELAKEGLKTDKAKSHEDHSLFGVFGLREYNLGPNLAVMAVLLGKPAEQDGKCCRVEQVGTREVPVYEVRCD